MLTFAHRMVNCQHTLWHYLLKQSEYPDNKEAVYRVNKNDMTKPINYNINVECYNGTVKPKMHPAVDLNRIYQDFSTQTMTQS